MSDLPILLLPGPPVVAGDGLAAALRAHGEAVLHAPDRDGRSSLRGLVDDALEALDAAGAGQAHLVAASTDGAVALALAADHPERIASLVLAGAWAAPDRALRATLATWTWAADHATALEDLVAAIGSSAHGRSAFLSGVADDRIAAASRSAATDAPAALRRARRLLVHAVRAATGPEAAAVRLDAVVAPTLVLTGEEDVVAHPAAARALAARLADARLEVLPATGHALLEQDPASVAARIARFHDAVAALGDHRAGATA